MVSWSSGKDSAWMLYQLQQNNDYEIVGLFTTINSVYSRVAMHGVHTDLLKEQAKSIGLPLHIIELPYPCNNEDYAQIMQKFVEQSESDGIDCFAFGDLFLEDIRDYRIERLKDSKITAIFPIWGIPTDQLSQELIQAGVKTFLTCVDTKRISIDFAGSLYDQALLDALPESCDPCGENGEFHTFVFAGPMMQYPLEVETGEIVTFDQFAFAELKAKQINQ